MTDRIRAFDALLSQPDPPCLVGRGHHLTCEGKSGRREQLALRFAIAFLQHRYLEKDPTPVLAPARRFPLRIWRRA